MPTFVLDQTLHKSQIRLCLFSAAGLSVRSTLGFHGHWLMYFPAQEGKVLYLQSRSLSMCLTYFLGGSAQLQASPCNKCAAASPAVNCKSWGSLTSCEQDDVILCIILVFSKPETEKQDDPSAGDIAGKQKSTSALLFLSNNLKTGLGELWTTPPLPAQQGLSQ